MDAHKYKCKWCGADFISYNPRPTFCSIKCKAEFQAPDLDISIVRFLYCSEGKSQKEVAELFGVSPKTILKAMRRHGIKARRAIKRNQFGDKNDSWKGDKAGYAASHKRLYAKYGKPHRCAVCGTTSKSKHYDYASLTGNYSDESDYSPMCRSCHWRYDDKIRNIKHMREKLDAAESQA